MVEPEVTPTEKEMQLLRLLRGLGWGEVKILVQHGEPVLLYETMKPVPLNDDDTAAQSHDSSEDEHRCTTIELFK